MDTSHPWVRETWAALTWVSAPTHRSVPSPPREALGPRLT